MGEERRLLSLKKDASQLSEGKTVPSLSDVMWWEVESKKKLGPHKLCRRPSGNFKAVV